MISTLDVNENLPLTGNGETIFNKAGEQIEHIPFPKDGTGNVTFGGFNSLRTHN